MFSAALHEGVRADPPFTAVLEPKISEAPWAPQGAAHKRANEQERARHADALQPPVLNAAQPALHYPRYIIAVEVAGAWQRLGGMGAALTRLAHTMELSITQNVETV